MEHLPFTHQVGNGSGHILDRDCRVHTVLVVEVDVVGTQPLQRTLHRGTYALRTAVLHLLPVFQSYAEFSGEYDFVAYRCKGFAHQFFIHVWAVYFGSIEEGHALVIRLVDKGDHLLSVMCNAVSMVHAHAA